MITPYNINIKAIFFLLLLLSGTTVIFFILIYHLIIGNSLHDSTEKFRYFESSGWEDDAEKGKEGSINTRRDW